MLFVVVMVATIRNEELSVSFRNGMLMVMQVHFGMFPKLFTSLSCLQVPRPHHIRASKEHILHPVPSPHSGVTSSKAFFSSEKLEEAGIIVAPSEEALKARKLKEAMRIKAVLTKQRKKQERSEATSSIGASANEAASTGGDIQPTASSSLRPVGMDNLNILVKLRNFKKALKAPKPADPSTEQQNVQGQTSTVIPPPHEERNPKKRGPPSDKGEAAAKKGMQDKSSDKVEERKRAIEAKPVFVAKEKGVCSLENTLLKGPLFDGAILVSDWLLKSIHHIEELEKMSKKLKATQAQLKKTFDSLTSTQKRADAEIWKLKEALEAKDDELVKAQEELKKLKDEQASLTRESIIWYSASDTFIANRLEEFWSKVNTFITPLMSTLVDYMKQVDDVGMVKWDPNWLFHDRIHEFCESWGETPDPSLKLRLIPVRPLAERSLWNLENLGSELRKKLEAYVTLAASGKLLAEGSVPVPGKTLKFTKKKKVTLEVPEKVVESGEVPDTFVHPTLPTVDASPKDTSLKSIEDDEQV